MTAPYRPLPVVQPAPVYCLHCVHRDDGYDCRLTYVLSEPSPIDGRSRVVKWTACDVKNAERDCPDFSERPRSWWERVFGRRYP